VHAISRFIPFIIVALRYDFSFVVLVEFATKHSRNCSCPTPCDVTSYETRLSYAQYPSEFAKQSAAIQLGTLSGRHNYSEFDKNYLERYQR
jgi:hypothetical protein